MKGKGILALAIVSILVVAGLVSAFVLWNSAESEMELTITYSNKVDYEPFIVAEELGYFEEEDLNVTTLVVSGGIQSAEAIMTGAADVGAMGDAPATQLLDKNTDAMIVCRYSGGEGMHRYIAQEDILTPKDLEGKKVGIQMGSSTHGSFMQWADANGISMSDVTLVPMNPADMPSAMETGQIDAMAGSEPWPTNVEKVCGEKVHEILVSEEEAHRTIERGDYYVIQPILPELCSTDERKPTLGHEYSSNDNIMQPNVLRETLENFDLMIKEGTTVNGELLR